MNDRIKKLAEEALGTRKHVPPVWQFFDAELEKFAELVIKDVVNTMLVEGCDFYHNESNDYGVVTTKFYTGEGNPWHTMRGKEETADFFGHVVKGTGYYKLNDEFVKYMIESAFGKYNG